MKKINIKNFEAPLALVYCALILTLMEYFFIPPRAEAWLNGPALFGWATPSLDAGIIWSASCFILYLLIPLGLTKIFGNSFGEFGFSAKDLLKHLRVYLMLFVVMLPLIYLASTQEHFTDVYPFVPMARTSVKNYLSWEIAYVLQFFALEFFFRGYLLYTVKKHVDNKWLAITIMLVPYVMIHFHKPVFETLGATIAGLVLGYLSLKNKSWLGGAILHSLVAVSLDSLSIYHSGFGLFSSM